jgi:hypothetical protein
MPLISKNLIRNSWVNLFKVSVNPGDTFNGWMNVGFKSSKTSGSLTGQQLQSVAVTVSNSGLGEDLHINIDSNYLYANDITPGLEYELNSSGSEFTLSCRLSLDTSGTDSNILFYRLDSLCNNSVTYL